MTTNNQSSTSLLGKLSTIITFLRYNASNIFAGKFFYFLGLAVAIYFTVIIIYVLDEALPPDAEVIYYMLLVPSVLLVFYPSCYSIQADVDSRMIETLFGIPDYRYKVWLVRNLTQYGVVIILLSGLAILSRFAIAEFSITMMLYHLLFPVIFIGSLGFLTSTISRSGNGTAVIMVIVLMVFWILSADVLEESRWNLFFNPFEKVDMYQTVMLEANTFYNRVYLIVGSIIATMLALLRLQKRERFI